MLPLHSIQTFLTDQKISKAIYIYIYILCAICTRLRVVYSAPAFSSRAIVAPGVRRQKLHRAVRPSLIDQHWKGKVFPSNPKLLLLLLLLLIRCLA